MGTELSLISLLKHILSVPGSACKALAATERELTAPKTYEFACW